MHARARACVEREREIRKIYSFKPLHLMKGSLKLERQTDRDRKTDSQADRYRDRQTEKIWIRQIYSFRSLHLMKECLQLMRERERERGRERERERERASSQPGLRGVTFTASFLFGPCFPFFDASRLWVDLVIDPITGNYHPQVCQSCRPFRHLQPPLQPPPPPPKKKDCVTKFY